MASRTSTGIAMGVTVTIFIVLTLALFVLTLVFFGQKNKITQDYNTLRDQQRDIIEASERNEDRVQTLMGERQNNESLVAYLIRSNRELKRLAVGNADVTVDGARERVAGSIDLSGASLLGYAEQLQAERDQAFRERDTARSALRDAQEDYEAEIDRVREIEASLQSTVSRATGRVDDYETDVASFRQGVDRYEQRLRAEVDEDRSEYEQRLDELEDRIGELTQENLVLNDTVRKLRGEVGSAFVSPRDEFALVDGEIVGIDPVENEAIISLGRQDKLSIGLTFSVYSDPSELRRDPETGEFREGKAVLEVVGIDNTSARARIIRERRGNPVVPGDIIANPLYDPAKVYKFIVFGSFDTDRDGRATAAEERRLKALIEEWGGEVVDDITGDLDFLVLGERPILPPDPGLNAPRAVVEEHVRLRRKVFRYNELFDQAQSASIPVINFNRLMTLIGVVPN
ncbi:MAG: hypothetical protein CMJ31_09805 [Phycisphaerae bacterium]|nr:hypothetical protein [Phycisphaerae bacterium]